MSKHCVTVLWMSIATACLLALLMLSLIEGSSVLFPGAGFLLLLVVTIATARRGPHHRTHR